jgi:hypothetical protein
MSRNKLKVLYLDLSQVCQCSQDQLFQRINLKGQVQGIQIKISELKVIQV